MQRTIDAAVLGFAFAEGAAAMRTTAVQRVKLPAEVEQRQFTIAHVHTQSAIRRNLVHFGNGNKFAHGHPSECWRRTESLLNAPPRIQIIIHQFFWANFLERASSSSPRDAGVGRGPMRGASKVPPLPSPLLHLMEERESYCSRPSIRRFPSP